MFRFLCFRIPKDTLVKGDVETSLPCSVHGTIEGSLRTSRSAYIQKTGKLHGNIRAGKIKIAGTVHGDVRADKLTVLPGGTVKGKIFAGHVNIHKDGLVEDIEEVNPIASPASTNATDQSWF